MSDFTIAVIADSHIHPEGDLSQACWPEDALFNDRNRQVVQFLTEQKPDFVIHLGDLVHPVPGLPSHQTANNTAKAIYERLPMEMIVVPGNHDIGDKPRPTTPVRRPDDELLGAHVQRWGPLFGVKEHNGVFFLWVNSPIMNTDHEEEARQWAWLERTVAELSNKRWFAFSHYPIFLFEPEEDEHYDNLAEPARSRLLSLFSSAEAVFFGHVHHFFMQNLGTTTAYLLPSTAFVRPGFSQLSNIGPGAAFGRDNTNKLGIFMLQITPESYHVSPVRTQVIGDTKHLSKGYTCPLGVTLRAPLRPSYTIPAQGLDPINTKTAHDDTSVHALLELGWPVVRMPVSQYKDAVWLKAQGARSLLFGVNTPDDCEGSLCYERIVPAGQAPPATGVWSQLKKSSTNHEGQFSHFPALGSRMATGKQVQRIAGHQCPFECELRSDIVLIEFQRASEDQAFTDDLSVARRVVKTYLLALKSKGHTLILDGWRDHDRGYFPYNALVDGAGNPRPAHRALVLLNRLIDPEAVGEVIVKKEPGLVVVEVVGFGAVWIPDRAEAVVPEGLCLTSWQRREGEQTLRPRWVF